MPTYPLDQVLRAQAALRTAAHLAPEQFPVEAFIGMVSDEIEALRAQGRTDEDIATLIQQSSGIAIDAETIANNYASPDARHPPEGNARDPPQ